MWKSQTDINPSHILRFGEKDNFWEMGDTVPCGPCSEIHIDLTQNGCKVEDVNSGNPEVIEIWNLVFIQYNRDDKGTLHELPQKHVDTGMGFERIVRVLQNKNSNYETDVFLPLINELINLSGKEYSGDNHTSAMNVIADHVRTLTFAIGDGAIPSNEGRGYVLRRILRRAARYGRNIGMHKPFIYNLVDVLVKNMSHVFPEIKEKQKFIKEVIQAEEESFNETLDRGLVYFNDEVENMEKTGAKIFSGEVAFKLHDTYGFPVDLTQLMAREKGYRVDVNMFEELMKVQKERSRKAIKDTSALSLEFNSDTRERPLSKYNPYIAPEDGIETEILGVFSGDKEDYIILKDNPFYFESGGQVGDNGKLTFENGGEVRVESSKELMGLQCLSKINFPAVGSKVIAKVDYPRRLSIQRNHSATHLVHEALRRVLGPHVKQMGSYLDDKVLRFDFPHFHKLKPEEIRTIEDIVNDKIKENIQVNWEFMQIGKADKIPNVKKFFGEKYGEEVRVVFIDEGFSVEFCGGTHVPDTSDIGLFKIVKEESISSGTRRIFARTGEGIIQLIDEKIADIEKLLTELPEKYANNFKSGINEFKTNFKDMDFRDAGILKKLIEYQNLTYNSLLDLHDKYLEEKKQAEKELTKQKVAQAVGKLDEIISKSDTFDGVKVASAKFEIDSMDELKEIGDVLRGKIGNGVGVLFSVVDNKVNIAAVVSDNLIKEKGLSAGKIAGDVARILGGGGGGKPHLATAGGKDVSKLDEAMKEVKNIVQKYLKILK